MSVRKHLSLGLCVLVAGLNPFYGGAQAGSDPTGYDAIDRYITARMRSGRIPGLALAIVKGDRVVYLKGYGRADPSGRPVTLQTPFLIGSITKPFTALAVLQLVEAGKVDLDAPVQRYIPWFRVADPKASARITVRMLINQTSGLPQVPTFVTWTWPDDAGAIERHVRLMVKVKPAFPPGQSFAYSNANYATLGLLVQAVSGRSYEDYIRRHIFVPLGMRNSFVSQDEAIRHGMASGHRWWFGFPVAVTLPFNRSNLPAGFIISSAEDMAHFLIAQMNGGRYRDVSVLSPEGIASMQAEPPPGGYRMAWESTRLDGRRLINYDGATANFQASLFFDPETREGVFIAANVMNALDTLSSAHGASVLNGITTRGMAESVLSLATDRPLPDQGVGIRRLSLIFDLLLLGLTGALAFSLARIPGRHRRLAQRGIAGRSDLARIIGRTAVLHFVWPLALLGVALKVPYWTIIALYQPDLVTWLYPTAAAVSLKGLFELAQIRRVFRRRISRG